MLFKKEIISFLKTQWRRPLSIFLFLSIASIVSLYWLLDVNLNNITKPKILITISLLLLIILCWVFYRMVPRNTKGNIGLVVSISIDRSTQHDVIKHDFIFHLRELLYNKKLRYPFSLIIFPQYYASKITNVDEALRYLRISKSHFMIYGRARVRNINGEEQHVLNLEGIVRHNPISEKIGDKFSSEFTELFPRRLIIARENDLFTFEITADLVNLVAMYIIGIASLLSGDLNYSGTLFEDLNTKLLNNRTNLPAIIKIRQRLPLRLTEVYIQQARLVNNDWQKSHSNDDSNKIKFWLDKLKLISPNNYNYCLLSAVWHFVENRDISTAKKEIRKCQKTKDAAWMYSSAFLYAYTGDLKKALRMYRRAFAHPYEPQVLFDVEEFICWIIDEEPDKIQFNFCLGLLNYFAKGDKISALRDFKKFIEANCGVMFDEEKRLAETYIDEINREIK